MPLIPLMLSVLVMEGVAFAALVWGMRSGGRSLQGIGFGFKAPLVAYLLVLLLTALQAIQTIQAAPYLANMYFQFPWLKLAAVAMACMAAVFEETFFRGYLITALKNAGYGDAVQVLISGLVFGVAHAIWGFANVHSWQSFIYPMTSTALGGLVAGAVYIASGRRLGPVILGHALFDALFEPGLLIAAIRAHH